jgi:hypothetical protein
VHSLAEAIERGLQVSYPIRKYVLTAEMHALKIAQILIGSASRTMVIQLWANIDRCVIDDSIVQAIAQTNSVAADWRG